MTDHSQQGTPVEDTDTINHLKNIFSPPESVLYDVSFSAKQTGQFFSL